MRRTLNSFLSTSAFTLYDVSLVHCREIKLGTLLHTHISNILMSQYIRCRDLDAARRLFDETFHRDTVSWNTIIGGYISFGSFDTSLDLLNSMKRFEFCVDVYTFGSLLKGAACDGRIDVGRMIHSDIVKTGYQENVYAGSALLDMYAKCGRVEDAYGVFQCMPERNNVSWNALIGAFSKLGDYEMAYRLMCCMEQEGFRVDDGTFAPLLTLLDCSDFYKVAVQIHCKILKHGLGCSNVVCNALINSYAECGSIDDAKCMFDGMVGSRDVVTWNSMLGAFLLHSQVASAIRLFLNMHTHRYQSDIYTYTSIISGCSEEKYQSLGRSLHSLVIRRGLEQSVAISNSLMAMYLKFNSKSMNDALRIYSSMELRDQVSWNSVLTGLSQTGLSEDALKCFKQMRMELVAVDQYAFSSVLRSCSDLATLQLGQQIHALALKSGWEANDYVASSLIFMYSKCGIIEDAKNSFLEIPQDTAITWNSIIFGYAQHGQGKVALDLFYLMRERKVKPDHITFVAVLTACSHIGFVEEGCNFLQSMESVYGIPPRMEHYACAIDLCGRAGRLDIAEALIKSMPFEPDSMVLKTLLGACRMCGNIELASQVASRMLELEPDEHCTYVLLSSIYSHLGRWNDTADLKRLMKERGVKKVPGWSWVEIKNEVHAFNAEDHLHPNCKEIYQMLEVLVEEMTTLDRDAKPDIRMKELDHEEDECFI